MNDRYRRWVIVLLIALTVLGAATQLYVNYTLTVINTATLTP